MEDLLKAVFKIARDPFVIRGRVNPKAPNRYTFVIEITVAEGTVDQLQESYESAIEYETPSEAFKSLEAEAKRVLDECAADPSFPGEVAAAGDGPRPFHTGNNEVH